MDERDFLDLFIDDEARNWQKRQIASRFGWLADWDADYDSGWVMKNHRFILRFWIAFDPETRREYLEFKRNPEKRREYDAESLLESRWEREFFEKWRDKVRARGERAFEQKAAALYFAFEPGVLAWFRDVWLSEEGYEYDSERDDRFLALILLDCDKRVKAPGIVETAFVQWVLPFVASITFLRAKGLGYNLEDYISDVYERLFAEGTRKNFVNSVDYWLKERPTASLREWVEVEALRVVHKYIQQQRRGEKKKSDEFKEFGANAVKFDETEAPLFEIQSLFDRFYKEKPAEAGLLALYFSNGAASYSDLSGFWNLGQDKKIGGSSLGQRCRRNLAAWRKICENVLAFGTIDEDAWKEAMKELKNDARSAAKETSPPREEKSWDRGGKPKSEDWRKNVQFSKTVFSTEDDEKLLKCVLTTRRAIESACFWRLAKSGGQEKTQWNGLNANNVGIVDARRWVDPLLRFVNGTGEGKNLLDALWQDVDEARMRAAGSPTQVSVIKMVKKFFRNKYPKASSCSFYLESPEERESPLYWRAEFRVPFDVSEETEIAVVVDVNDPFWAAPVEFTFGGVVAPVNSLGVAKFKAVDLRLGIEKGTASATIMIRRFKAETPKRSTRWREPFNSPGRLLFRPPVVPENVR